MAFLPLSCACIFEGSIDFGNSLTFVKDLTYQVAVSSLFHLLCYELGVHLSTLAGALASMDIGSAACPKLLVSASFNTPSQ